MGASEQKVYFRNPQRMEFEENQYVVIVRHNPDDDEMEVISTGRFKSRPREHILLDDLNFKKLPQAGDLVAKTGDPLKKKDEKAKAEPKNILPDAPTVSPLEAGYIEFSYLTGHQNTLTESPNQANAYKQINNLSDSGFRLRWFLDFFPNYGIDYQTRSGQVPIQSYYRSDVSATLSEQLFRLNYRNSKIGHSWRWNAFVESFSTEFQTNNPDEAVISTAAQGVGIGASLKYEPYSPLYSAKSTSMVVDGIGLEFSQSLMGTAVDALVSRGSSSRVSRQSLSLVAGTTLYLPWVPYINRYFIEASYTTTNWSMAFSGPTRKEIGGPIEIPSGGTYAEKEKGWKILIGIRYDDLVGRIFKPKN